MRLYSDSFYYHCTIHQSKSNLPYLLMLHGFMGSGEVFDHLVYKISDFCNPVTIDLAGHGKTESTNNSKFYTTERQVHQLYSVIQRFQFDNLYLYGYSMGGRLAFHLIASHADLFAGAILESSHCGIDSETARSDRKNMDEKRAQQIEDDFKSFVDDWIEMPLFQHTQHQMKSVYEEVMKAQNPEHLSASLIGFGAGVMPSVCDKISALDLPITLVAGELDHKYVEKMTLINKKVDSSNLQIVENAGHRVHADQPKELTLILKNSLKV